MFNANKAGLQDVDKDEINRVIEDASRGTPFWEHQKRRDERHAQRIQKTLEKIAAASPKEVADAEEWTKSTLQRLANFGGFPSAADESCCRYVIHVDLDAFYASVEERDDPKLHSVPMAVGSTSMLSTSNYAARKFGVRAGLPGFIAKKLCPQLVIVPPNFEKYERASTEIMNILSQFSSQLSVFGLDEAALDITEYCRSTDGGLSPDEATERIRAAVREATGLTCSAGIASNQLLAKICADINKPNGQFRLGTAEEVEKFLTPLSVRKIPGIGQVQEKILAAMGIKTCGDLLENGARLYLAFGGASTESYLSAAKGCSSTCTQGRSTRSRKSKSAEATFRDSADPKYLADVVTQLCARLSEELIAAGLRGRLVTLKVKMSSFDVFSRSVALEVATNTGSVMEKHAQRILRYVLERREGQALRLLGVKMSNFEDEQAQGANQRGRQTTLSQLLTTSRVGETSEATTLESGNSLADKETPVTDLKPACIDLEKPAAACNQDTDSDVPMEEDAEITVQPYAEQLQCKRSSSPERPNPRSSSEEPRVSAESASASSPQTIQLDSPQRDNERVLIDETYCPICGIIMRDVSEFHVSRHVDECLRREEQRERAFAAKDQGTSKAKSSKMNAKKPPIKRKASSGGSSKDTAGGRATKRSASGSIESFFTR